MVTHRVVNLNLIAHDLEHPEWPLYGQHQLDSRILELIEVFRQYFHHGCDMWAVDFLVLMVFDCPDVVLGPKYHLLWAKKKKYIALELSC